MNGETSPALLLDLYELTMADAYRRESMADRPATFSLFVRSEPANWGYLVAAGLDDCLLWLEQLHFTPADLEAVARLRIFPDEFLVWLGELRFTGSVRAVPEGTIVFAGEPLLEVDGPVAEAQLAETYLLNQMTLQTGLATQASRCRHAAGGRAVVDFALRRAPGVDAGMKLARCSRLVGLSGSSNVAGAHRYGVASSGTMGHSFVQAHRDETAAFRAYAQVFREATVLLVDTYDTAQGIERAIEVARKMRREGVELRGVRLDSGDLGAEAFRARRRLDQEGFPTMTIFVSGGLDEYSIERLVKVEGAPIDGFGVGTSLGTAGKAPTLDSVYKMVSYDGRAVRKTSPGKETWPGPKQLWRDFEWQGDILAAADEPAPEGNWEPLLKEVMRDGRLTAVGQRSLADSHRHFESQWSSLPIQLKSLTSPPRYPVVPSGHLLELTAHVDRCRAEIDQPTRTKSTGMGQEAV